MTDQGMGTHILSLSSYRGLNQKLDTKSKARYLPVTNQKIRFENLQKFKTFCLN
jgi:hypothetical protein